MSGHSKWANTKHRKMAQDSKKGQAFARVAREIIMAAKLGGGDPAGNFRLRTALERARAAGLSNETAERAIAKGTGQLGADNVETLIYEGYGPGGVAIYVQAMSDNRNRTAGDVRSTFSKYGGNLGETGCVGWMFKEFGEIIGPLNGQKGTVATEDSLLELGLEAGADDVEVDEAENLYRILTPPEALNTVCETLQAESFEIESASITRQAETTVAVTDADIAKPLLKLLDKLEAFEDVQNVYANFEMDEDLQSSCAPQ